MRFITALFILLSFTACDNANDTTNTIIKIDSSVTKTDVISAPGDIINVSKKDTILAIPPMYIERLALVAFAKTFLGTPYVYGSKDPDVGFDCSGFIYYVFTHFNIDVPRSSVEFTSLGEDVNIKNARPGDLILFTGTDSNIRIVGHMGIVIENTDTLKFIQASSGRAYSVVITPLDNYYQGRLMKIISMLPDYSTSVLPTDSAKTLGKTSLISSKKIIAIKRSRRHRPYVHLKKHHYLKTHHSSHKKSEKLSKTHHHSIKTHHHKK